MYKRLKIMLMILFSLILSSCSFEGTKKNNLTYNTNKEIKDDWYLEYKLSNDTFIKEVNIDTAIERLKSDKGILILASTDCPYCHYSLPLIDELAKEYNFKNIYYVDARTIDQEKRKILNNFLGNIFKPNSEGNILLKIPDVYAIKEHKILENYRESENNKKSLKNKYRKLFEVLH